MSEMVERVARAIAKARGMDPDGKSVTAFEGAPLDCKVWETLVPSARAAISVMREPTELMVDAAWDCDGATVYDDNASGEVHWRAMIDAALKQP